MTRDEGSYSGSGDADARKDSLVGHVLADRYRLLSKLGEGGMGAVYVAQHTTLEKRVAIKVLHGEFARNRGFVQRFLREGRAASKIGNEHIIDVTDFGETDDGFVFFTMELLEGSDLYEVLQRNESGAPLPWKRARSIFLQVCAGLQAAHAQGIVHRDLKPENIFLTERYGQSDFVKILDFGLAKLINEGKRLTKTGELFGTPEYMSPEQARGDEVDVRSDIYAMGCMLYQMTTGRAPFASDSFMGVLTQQLLDEPPPLAPDLPRGGAPGEVEAIVLRALSKDRGQRYQSITDFAAAVRALPEREGGAPVEPTTGQWTGTARIHITDHPPIAGATQRRRFRWGFAQALLLAGACAGAAYMYIEELQPAANLPSHEAEPGSAAAKAAQGIAPLSIITLRIESDPLGADVLDQDGDKMGVTPYEFEAPATEDVEQITLNKLGFARRTIDISFTASRAYNPTLSKLDAPLDPPQEDPPPKD